MDEIICIECGSNDTAVAYPGVGKCFLCGSYFDLEELPTKVEKIKHKQYEEDEDNGV